MQGDLPLSIVAQRQAAGHASLVQREVARRVIAVTEGLLPQDTIHIPVIG